jgi:ATP-dependent protease HslVU (ClpYQ) peptidase subunit
MADGSGDYLSRFERLEKSLELVAATMTKIVAIQQAQAERMDHMDAKIDRLATIVDDLVGPVRSLISRMPPQILQ